MHWSSHLDEKELNILEDWLDKFMAKYRLVGYIENDMKKTN